MSSELRFHHVGVACRNIGEALRFLEAAGSVLHASNVVHDSGQRADVCLVRLAGGVTVELVAGEAVAGLVAKGVTYYHLAYEVDDLGTALEELRRGGSLLVSGPSPAPLFEGRSVAFLYSPLGLVELVSSS